jgi:hypothetical protein
MSWLGSSLEQQEPKPMENAVFTRNPALEGAPSSRNRALAHLALGPSMLWTGRVLSGVYALFILGASVTPKLLQVPIVDEKMVSWGWPAGSGLLVGFIELSCVLLYLIPRTSVLGAVLMMSVLGGAIVTHIVAQDPLFSHVLFPIYVGVFMWGGLWLRSAELRALFPLFQRKQP